MVVSDVWQKQAYLHLQKVYYEDTSTKQVLVQKLKRWQGGKIILTNLYKCIEHLHGQFPCPHLRIVRNGFPVSSSFRRVVIFPRHIIEIDKMIICWPMDKPLSFTWTNWKQISFLHIIQNLWNKYARFLNYNCIALINLDSNIPGLISQALGFDNHTNLWGQSTQWIIWKIQDWKT